MRTSPTIRTLAALVLFGLVLAGCGSSGENGATSENQRAGSDAWRSIEITDVDGNTFTVESLTGTPVLVENFATWCSNCRKQLGKTQQAAADAGDDAIFLALSVETDLDPADVAEYAKDNGFDDIRFAVMTPEMLKAMNDAFGNSALNPPSTPKVIVAADGTVGELVTGFEEPADIAAALGQA
jgi:cytochrome oxidase Cu insertion factor (SCO1/SenC/PrrC family)